MATNICDLSVQLRYWLLSIPEVAAWVDGAVIDTVDTDTCHPFIWYTRAGQSSGNTLNNCGGGLPEDALFEIEIIDHELKLSKTRQIAECIRQAADQVQRSDEFGKPGDGFHVQLVDVQDVGDNYASNIYRFINNICFTAMTIEITPL